MVNPIDIIGDEAMGRLADNGWMVVRGAPARDEPGIESDKSLDYQQGFQDAVQAAPDPEQVERIRDEYQRFYDFVAKSEPALVDAWHFTEHSKTHAHG